MKRLGVTKTEFARRMGIRKQNVKVLFKTNDLRTIRRAAEVLKVPFELLISYTSEPDLTEECPLDAFSASFPTAEALLDTVKEIILGGEIRFDTPERIVIGGGGYVLELREEA